MMQRTETGANLAINTLVRLIWKHGALTRADLSRYSGFSRSTVSVNIDRLLSMNIVREQRINGKDDVTSKRTKLSLNLDRGVFVGIELDADHCDIGFCDIQGKLLTSVGMSINYEMGPDLVLENIVAVVQEMQRSFTKHNTTILGVGVGLPTPVDFEGGYAVHPAFMPGWHRYPVKSNLQAAFGAPVFVDNEVNTMGLGEAYLSKRFRESNLLFVKLGLGIGAGLVIGGECYRGNSGLSGNIGHIRVNNHTDQCKCGKEGCLEAIAGGWGLIRQAEELVTHPKCPTLTEAYERKNHLDIEDIQLAVDRLERPVLNIVYEAAKTIGPVLGRAVQFFDPKAVVLGGALCSLGPQFIDYIRQGIVREASPWVRSDFEISLSKFGDSIGVIGSAMLCISTLMQNNAILPDSK